VFGGDGFEASNFRWEQDEVPHAAGLSQFLLGGHLLGVRGVRHAPSQFDPAVADEPVGPELPSRVQLGMGWVDGFLLVRNFVAVEPVADEARSAAIQ
jgi:hypothetical protein